MKKVIKAALFIGIVLAINLGMVVLIGAQRPVEQHKPEIRIYKVMMEDSTTMRCGIAFWFDEISLNCNWKD